LQKWNTVAEFAKHTKPKNISLQIFIVLTFIPDSHVYRVTEITNISSTRYRERSLPNMQPEIYDTK
jgi:hypothetical protein